MVDAFIMVINKEGKILYCNDHYQQQLSIRFPRLCLKNIFERIHPIDQDMFNQAIQEVAQLHREREIHYRFSNSHEFITFRSVLSPKEVTADRHLRIKIVSELLDQPTQSTNIIEEEQQEFFSWLRERKLHKRCRLS